MKSHHIFKLSASAAQKYETSKKSVSKEQVFFPVCFMSQPGCWFLGHNLTLSSCEDFVVYNETDSSFSPTKTKAKEDSLFLYFTQLFAKRG